MEAGWEPGADSLNEVQPTCGSHAEPVTLIQSDSSDYCNWGAGQPPEGYPSSVWCEPRARSCWSSANNCPASRCCNCQCQLPSLGLSPMWGVGLQGFGLHLEPSNLHC